MGGTRVTGGGPEQMRLLAAKLKTADPKLRRDLRRAFRNQADPIVRDVRASILSMPSHHDGTLRGDVAATIRATTSITASGVRLEIVSAGSRMPPGEGTMPTHLDAAKGFAHPVYARGPRRTWAWVRQMGKPGFFETPIARKGGDVRDACQRALNETARRLA